MRAPELMRAVEERLGAAGCVAATEEAEELVGRAPDRATVEAWTARRAEGEPLAWIVGALEFCGRDIAATAGVYVPRPQTEQLAIRAAGRLPPGGRAADLCSGTGAVAAHLRAAVAGARVVATDIDPRAAACARRNGVAALVTDVGAGLRAGVFDVVTAVAPYVPTAGLGFLPSDVQRYEPRLALDGGPDGLDVVRRVVAAASRLLRPGGWLLIELGADQDASLGPALASGGFVSTRTWHDEEGDLRGLATQRAPGRDGGVLAT
ncbi:MAG TPA: methyltransferase domain-containing protein [Acidimicrobiales bacterium]|nr:methyltransferase domain-containing protein [Acidimicrobiales bacterium]